MSKSIVILPLIMALSSTLQFIAAVMAIRLIRPSGFFSAWILLASGFIVQGMRRIVALVHVLGGQVQGDMTVEIFGLVISLLMLCGIIKFKPLFDEINHSHQALLAEHKKLSHANSELEAFVSTVSHDLRTPLTVIIGYAEHLRQECASKLDEQELSYLKEIEDHGGRMTALMEDLLVLSKVGYVERPAKPVDADVVVQDILTEFGARLAIEGIAINKTALPRLHVPETLLAEIFKNLIGNALHYACEKGASIEIGGKKEGDLVRFFVRDHGPGVPEEERGRIFEIFYRGSTGKKSKGTGIGLAIVQKIAQLYGGGAWVEETPQGGSTFWFEMIEASPNNPTTETCET